LVRPLTYDLDLQSQASQCQGRPIMPKIKVKCQNGSNRRAPTDKRMDTHTDATKRIISSGVASMEQMEQLLPPGLTKPTSVIRANPMRFLK